MDRFVLPLWTQGGQDIPTVCKEKSMTRQSDLEGSDINGIMKRYEKTGVLPMDTREALFQDVSGIGSYRDAMEVVMKAQEGFYALSPAIRERFGNDPVAFLDFTSREENRDELVKLGVLEAPAEAVAPKVEPSAGAAAVAQ